MANPPNLFDRDRLKRHHRSGDPRTHLPTAQRIKNQQLGQAQTQPSQEDLNQPRVFRSLALSAAPLENTFTMVLTSAMSKVSTGLNSELPVGELDPLSAGPGYPNFDQEHVPQNFIQWDPFIYIGQGETANINFAVPITGFGIETAVPVDHFVLKRNRRYRFDFSHPSLKTIFPQSSGHANPTGYPYAVDAPANPSLPYTDRSILTDDVDNFFQPVVFRPNNVNKAGDLYGHTVQINIDQAYKTKLLGLSTFEGITQVGTPGTPGAYMDLVTHEGLPPSFFFTNSGIPDKYDNSTFTETGKYLEKQVDGFGPSMGAFPNPNFRITLYRDNEDDFKIYPLTYPSYDDTRSPHLSCGYMNMEGRPVPHPSLSAGLNLDETWLDTRTRTITAFTDKVLSKVDTNGLFNNHPILSSIDFNWGEIMVPGLTYNQFPQSTSGQSDRNNPLHLKNSTVMRDYYNPLIKGTTSYKNGAGDGTLSAWNPNWWGYAARDVLDFSGVSNESEGFSPAHQTIMVTPRHCIAGNHWGSRPRIGDKVFHLEHNTGKRVSGTIIDIVTTKDRLKANDDGVKGKGWNEVLNPDAIGARNNDGEHTQPVHKRSPFGAGDMMICKLHRDMTLPDPEVEGSDGSIKIYKFGRFRNPMMWFREEGQQDYTSVATNTNMAFISGFSVYCSLPMIFQTGFGSLGRFSYENGDEYTTLKLQHLIQTYAKQTSYESFRNITSQPGVSSVFSSSFNQIGTDPSFTDFNLLSSNPILENKANLRLGGRRFGIVGDSGNPGFYIVETRNEPLQMVAAYGTSNSYPTHYGNAHLGRTKDGATLQDGTPIFYFTIHIADGFNMALSGMEGGNPEGYGLQWVDIT